jgi:phosphoesterase RecJ-like protein
VDLEHVDLEYIHDFNNLVEDIQCFILLREVEPNRVRVSIRSKSDLDISRMVRALGGGGHPNAAGLTWHGPVEEIKSKILQELCLLFDKQEARAS